MRFATLSEWLDWQEGLHPETIDLGLQRVAEVWQALKGQVDHSATIITVAGTNGKGSTANMLHAMYHGMGYSVGVYTSPHLVKYNERIVVNDEPVSDDDLIQAFGAVDAARGEVSLTYFEFGSLAAVYHFLRCKIDIIILEVGLGGRLDAVNLFHNHVSIITNISLDHQQWLGEDRESIAREKAGVMRKGRPVIFADTSMPQAIQQEAQRVGAKLYRLGEEYNIRSAEDHWYWVHQNEELKVDYPGLPGRFQLCNAAAAIMALHCLNTRHPVDWTRIGRILSRLVLNGRLQRLPGLLLDVAHNPAAAQALADYLQAEERRIYALFTVMADKDLAGIITPLASCIEAWWLLDLGIPRAQSTGKIRETLTRLNCPYLGESKDVGAALQQLRRRIGPNALILVFGSFYHVAEVVKNADKITA